MNSISTMSAKKRSLTAVAINAAIFVAQTLCVAAFWERGGEGNMLLFGFDMFRFFTVDSNVFCALASLCLIPLELKKAVKPQSRIPKWALLFKFMATVTVTLTLLVVVVFLGPISGNFFNMFTGGNLHMHLVGPLMAITSFCFFEDFEYLKKNTKLLPLIPVLTYGIVYAVMVLVIGPENGGWYDFYSFNMGGMWYVTFVVIGVVTAAISLLEFGLNQRRFKNVRKS